MEDKYAAPPIEEWDKLSRTVFLEGIMIDEMIEREYGGYTGDIVQDNHILCHANLRFHVSKRKDDPYKSDTWKILEKFVESKEFTPEMAYELSWLPREGAFDTEEFENIFLNWYIQQSQLNTQTNSYY